MHFYPAAIKLSLMSNKYGRVPEEQNMLLQQLHENRIITSGVQRNETRHVQWCERQHMICLVELQTATSK